MTDIDDGADLEFDGRDLLAAPLAAGVSAWQDRAATSFPAEIGSERARAALLGVPQSTYRGWMLTANAPRTDALLRFHRRTDFKIGEQIRLLFGIGEQEFDVRLPLWEPRFTAEYLIDNLRAMLLKSRMTAPSVVDLGEALIASCRETEPPRVWWRH